MIDVLDGRWQPPYEYRQAQTTRNIIEYWLRTSQEASGQRPVYSPHAMQGSAEFLIAKLGYNETLRTLAWMATPMSKFFQYPYTLDAVQRGHDELSSVQAQPKLLKERAGFIGPVGQRDLTKKG
jgi:hypothetical protein